MTDNPNQSLTFHLDLSYASPAEFEDLRRIAIDDFAKIVLLCRARHDRLAAEVYHDEPKSEDGWQVFDPTGKAISRVPAPTFEQVAALDKERQQDVSACLVNIWADFENHRPAFYFWRSYNGKAYTKPAPGESA